MKDKTHTCKHCGATDSHFSFQCATQRKPIKPKVGDIFGTQQVVSIDKTSNKPLQTVKKPKPINKVSSRMKERLRLYYKVREDYLDGNIGCEAKLSGCNGTATDIHHKAGKTGDLLFDDQYFLAVCRTCHFWIEEHPKDAKKRGLSVERLNK